MCVCATCHNDNPCYWISFESNFQCLLFRAISFHSLSLYLFIFFCSIFFLTSSSRHVQKTMLCSIKKNHGLYPENTKLFIHTKSITWVFRLSQTSLSLGNGKTYAPSKHCTLFVQIWPNLDIITEICIAMRKKNFQYLLILEFISVN